MAGIAGILKSNEALGVKKMLDTIAHRGGYGKEIFELDDATIGIVWSEHEDERMRELIKKNIYRDGPGFGHNAEIARVGSHWEIHRDELGVAPFYTALTEHHDLLFASEVKALLPDAKNITEMPPGYTWSEKGLKQNFVLGKKKGLPADPGAIARGLLAKLTDSVKRRIHSDTMGAWLSGGLDSSSIAALVRPHVKTLHTFTGGLKDAPDFKYAGIVADHIGSKHHEIVLTLESMLRILPDVIYQMESFDALFVRSGIVNLTVAYEASEYVSEVFTGEGGDELFAGYEYMKALTLPKLDEELIKITGSLHKTALHRVDRTASAFGITAHVIFTDPEVLDYALQIPVALKLKDGVGKWILREAMRDLLPESIVTRTKSRFWEGAGVGDLLADYASEVISDHDFRIERFLKNGNTLRTKEELFYYRIFKEHFGEPDNLDWMGRTKGNPAL